MSATASPTIPSSQLTSDQLTVVAACFSSLVFFVVIVVLLSIIYRKDPQCCRLRSYQGPHADMGSQLFYVGLPSSYSLPSLERPLPRLPSYESVRKKDRQRQIHMMIADRFGLNGPIETEPPPSYEESIRQSVELPYNILSSSLDASPTLGNDTNSAPDFQTELPHPDNSESSHNVHPAFC
ncbi:uncharacterized protein si:ch73-364h19.1 isoform X2 [Phyllopteryx taeniolatus]|uniref:uncharacterized protein si:ch73-364h19.1 isoform X2 n=1 Tax=Phyllopteryx taeniolatus TaxID=161469 RepID=UPI002AD26929|nr:uncharacterized protein si:ch73-364h19.1 isoform X2 [Phyllopteryx taeniolatus]